MPALEQNCTADCRDSYISNNSDWVNVETVISTSPDQIAIAPGSLQREWSENGRHYFQYKLDHYSLNYYSFLSARYEVARSEWNGINIEVYYLKEHPWNVPKMLNSVKKSFDYYTQNFGPYPQKQARIIEFPRIASLRPGISRNHAVLGVHRIHRQHREAGRHRLGLLRGRRTRWRTNGGGIRWWERTCKERPCFRKPWPSTRP